MREMMQAKKGHPRMWKKRMQRKDCLEQVIKAGAGW